MAQPNQSASWSSSPFTINIQHLHDQFFYWDFCYNHNAQFSPLWCNITSCSDKVCADGWRHCIVGVLKFSVWPTAGISTQRGLDSLRPHTGGDSRQPSGWWGGRPCGIGFVERSSLRASHWYCPKSTFSPAPLHQLLLPLFISFIIENIDQHHLALWLDCAKIYCLHLIYYCLFNYF